MKNNDFFKNKMAEEINYRLKSEEWNTKIAGAVIEKRDNSMKRKFYTVSVSSLAAAAAAAIVFSGILNNKSDGMIYDEFITAQIKGTYDAASPVKKKNIVKKTAAVKTDTKIQNNDELVFTEDIDSLISETLALR